MSAEREPSSTPARAAALAPWGPGMAPWALLALLVVLVFGLARLFVLRFGRGDIYPPGSSLRADPLGARALFEGLERLPGVSVRRLLGPLRTAPTGPGQTLLVLGLEAGQLAEAPEQDVAELEQWMRSGGRLVIALRPDPDGEPGPPGQIGATNAPPRTRPGAPPAVDAGMPRRLPLTSRWGFAIEPNGTSPDGAAVRADAEDPLPERLAWHGDVGFGRLSTEWRVLYRRAGSAVVIERPFGPGSLVLSSDVFAFSNEAQRRDRQAALLAWFLGRAHLVIFDETHLGVAEEPGLATLARRYRLHGFAAGILFVLGLAVWRSQTSLLPRGTGAAPETGGALAGRDRAAGLVNLLRRALPPDDLLPACLEEWQRHAPPGPRNGPQLSELAAILGGQAALPESARDPVAAYRAMVRVVHHPTGAGRGPGPAARPEQP